MALLSGYEGDEQKKSPTSMASFNLALDPSNPLGFLAKVFDFVAKESDLFKCDSDVNAVVRMVKAYKVEAEEKNSRVSGSIPPVQPPAISTTTCIDAATTTATADTLTTVTPLQPPSLSHVLPEVVTVNQYPAAAATLAAIQSASAASPQLPISSSLCLESLSSLLQNPDFLNALSPISSHISLPHLQAPVPPSPPLPLTPLPIPDLTQLVPIKLDTDNYLLWKSLISCVLISYDLYGYVDGSIVCPSYFIIDGFGRSIPNPSHSHWIRTNSSVKSWLMATISQDILVEVHKLSTSQDIWVVLETRFIQQSTMYKIELSNIKKGNEWP